MTESCLMVTRRSVVVMRCCRLQDAEMSLERRAACYCSDSVCRTWACAQFVIDVQFQCSMTRMWSSTNASKDVVDNGTNNDLSAKWSPNL